MSSVYSSRRNSLIGPPFNEASKSVPQTPAKKQHKPIFRTVPDSPSHNRLLSEDDGLDLEILTHKLQLYQLELEEASLRFKQRRMHSREAEDVAAAARFLDNQQVEQDGNEGSSSPSHTRSRSMFAPRTSSLRLPPPPATTVKLNRAKRPNPLQLNATSDVRPQEVQSAALPPRRERVLSTEDDKTKRHWRRTTIAAGRESNSKIFLMTSPGNLTEYDFSTDRPPVLQLQDSASACTTPAVLSPVTPLPLAAEDMIRRELETFALEEGPDLTRSRQSSIASRKRLPTAFVPSPQDRLEAHDAQYSGTADATEISSMNNEPDFTKQPLISRKKSIFRRFERKNEVDAILDLYVTEDQLGEEKLSKKKSLKSRRQTFFKRFQVGENTKVKKDGAG